MFPPTPKNGSGVTTVLTVLLGTLAAGLYLVGLALDLFWLKLLSKPWPVLALALAVWHLAGRGGRVFSLGLIAGAVGDVCLALPGGFLAGMLAFAIGHGCYVAGFLRWTKTPATGLFLPVLVFAGTGLALMLPGAGSFTVPLVIYVAVISLMIWRAAACALDGEPDFLTRWGALAGALVFAFSDMLIGLNRFHAPLPGSAYAIILTYWCGQALIATAAIRRRAES